ncbi:MAG TPA: diacylglycerol kinase family protein [Dongiaceae bacterium]|nr:diacylglycerol kinase family protein [Dongiaceae bacterium]
MTTLVLTEHASDEKTTEAVCILNCAAGTCDAESAAALFRRIAAEHGAACEILAPERGADLPALARRAVEQGAAIVVAGGGDGTINAVASALVGTEAALGVLPLGTLNHFAKDLGIPLALDAAIRNVFTGRPRAIDVGAVNDRLFLNNSSLGIYPRIVRLREAHQRKGVRKWIAFAKALGYVLRHPRSLYLRIRIDAAHAGVRKTPFIFIGNNRYEISGLSIGKRVGLAGGRIWICQAPDAGRWGLFRLTLRALAGRIRESDLEAAEAREVWIDIHPRGADVSADGEVMRLAAPFHYRSRPGALRVIVPPEAPAG